MKRTMHDELFVTDEGRLAVVGKAPNGYAALYLILGVREHGWLVEVTQWN